MQFKTQYRGKINVSSFYRWLKQFKKYFESEVKLVNYVIYIDDNGVNVFYHLSVNIPSTSFNIDVDFYAERVSYEDSDVKLEFSVNDVWCNKFLKLIKDIFKNYQDRKDEFDEARIKVLNEIQNKILEGDKE